MFVVRETDHPQEDLKRNFSSPLSGWDNELADLAFSTAEEAAEKDMQVNGGTPRDYRYHPAYDGYVVVHYDGLGAWVLEASTLEEAIEEAKNIDSGLACTTEAGDGHFYAEDVINYYEVESGLYVFEIKD